MVTDGSYSDYHVVGIYSTSEKAEYAKNLYMASNDVHVMEVDSIPDHPAGHLPWNVSMDINGDVSGVNRTAGDNMYHKWYPTFECELPSGDKWKFSGFTFCVWAENEAHAVKISSERRREVLAESNFNVDWNDRESVENYWRRSNNIPIRKVEPTSWDVLVEMTNKANENS